MDIINVALYGGKSIFGGKEEPLIAEIIYCDKYKKCSYYRNNTCLNVGFKQCDFGYIEKVKGYTSRAKKYHEFKSRWMKHEKYNKLKLANKKLGIIDDVVVIPYSYFTINEKEDGDIEIFTNPFIHKLNFIKLEKLTTKLIKRICDYKPTSLFGKEIKDYKRKCVPLFLSHLKEILPDKYSEFISNYPKYADRINYVGRIAYLKTINPSYVCYRSETNPELNEKWYWDGEYLHFIEGHVSKVFVTDNYEVIEFKLKPSDKSTIVITDNEQVNENTIFVD